jgi:hypothetical protein
MITTQNNYKVNIETDYIGNIYFKCNELYYIVIINTDLPTGIDLVKLNNPDIFRNNLRNSHFIDAKCELLPIMPITLQTKIKQEINSFNCVEETYFSTPQLDDDNDCDNEYNFYGDNIFSELLSFRENSFNTILINGDEKSKDVKSFIERSDKFSPYTLVIYTTGILKLNCDTIIISQLSFVSDELVCIKI